MRLLLFMLAAGVMRPCCRSARDEVRSQVADTRMTAVEMETGSHRDTVTDTMTVYVEAPVLTLARASGDTVMLSARSLTLTRGRQAGSSVMVSHRDTLALINTDTVYVERHQKTETRVVSYWWPVGLMLLIISMVLVTWFKFKHNLNLKKS